MNLMFLHQNDSFALFGKAYLNTGLHMNAYFIAASQLIQKIWCQAQYILLHDSFVSNTTHASCIINTPESKFMRLPLQP